MILFVFASESETSKKLKADSSIKSYDYLAPADFSQHGNSNFNNALQFLKSLEGSPMSTNPHLNQVKIGKSIVEFWPPDMDKKKFFTDMVGPSWTKPSSNPVIYAEEIEISTDLPPIERLPENLPDIPIHNYEEIEVYEKKTQIPKRKQHKPIIEDQIEFLKITEPVKEVYKIANYDNLDHPKYFQTTESYFNFADENGGFAITNPGPVRFPTTESDIIESTYDYITPSTALPTRAAGNRKRKLKKKAKTTQNNAHFFETTASIGHNIPPVADVTVNAISPENVHVQIIDGNGFTETTNTAFQPIKYTNVIDTVSNLTEQSFRNGNDDRSSYSTSVEEVAENKSNESSEFTEFKKEKSFRTKSVNELKPWDFMFVQLSRAIEDRDLMKIKTLVNAISEKEKTRKVKKVIRGRVTTTRAPFEEITRAVKTTTTTEIVTEPPVITTTTEEPIATTEVIDKTTRRKYIAPRFRAVTLKKSIKDNDFNEDSKENLSTETQTFATRPSTLPISLKIVTTTTELPTTTVTNEPTTIVTEAITNKVRTAQRLKLTTEKSTVPVNSTTFRTRSRRGRIVTPRNKNFREIVTTTSSPSLNNHNSSTFRTIRSSSRVRRIKGMRRMTGMNSNNNRY